MKTFLKGGVHPPTNKITADSPIRDIDLPRRVVISLSQSIGRPARETVAKGDHVDRLQCIGEAQGPISANVHTPISGTVTAIDAFPDIYGHPLRSVVIEADEADHIADIQAIADAKPIMSLQDALDLEPVDISEKIRHAGIVGLGGATFPTAVKLSADAREKHPILLINGAECEPYLTCDNRIMIEMAEEVIAGVALMGRAIEASAIYIGIEDNKPQAIKAMTAAAHPYPYIEVVPLQTRYPQGGEKMLTYALTGRAIAPGQLPLTEGVVIQNVATALAVYHAVVWGIPLVERVVTVSGHACTTPGNFRVPIGTPIDLIASLGAPDEADTVRIVAGGTMMGRSVAAITGATTKGFSGFLFLTDKETARPTPEINPCVRCGRCVDACPMGLEPWLIARQSELHRYEEARENHARDCMECGCCSYVCIAQRPLVDFIRIAKMTN